jgi:hypothetical protein
MGFVHYLAEMDGCTPAQKPFNALKQYSVAIRGHAGFSSSFLWV